MILQYKTLHSFLPPRVLNSQIINLQAGTERGEASLPAGRVRISHPHTSAVHTGPLPINKAPSAVRMDRVSQDRIRCSTRTWSRCDLLLLRRRDAADRNSLISCRCLHHQSQSDSSRVNLWPSDRPNRVTRPAASRPHQAENSAWITLW